MDKEELELIKAAAEKKAKEAVEAAKGELDVDVQGKIDTLKKDMDGKIEAAQTAEQVKSIVDETLKAINTQVEKLELALKEQGEKLQDKGKSTEKISLRYLKKNTKHFAKVIRMKTLSIHFLSQIKHGTLQTPLQ